MRLHRLEVVVQTSDSRFLCSQVSLAGLVVAIQIAYEVVGAVAGRFLAGLNKRWRDFMGVSNLRLLCTR